MICAPLGGRVTKAWALATKACTVVVPNAAPFRLKARSAFCSLVKRRLDDHRRGPPRWPLDETRVAAVSGRSRVTASGALADVADVIEALCTGTAEAPPSQAATNAAAANAGQTLINPTTISLHLPSKSVFEQTKNTGLGIGQASPGVVR